MRLIRGGPGSGKTRLVLTEFADAVRTDPARARLIAPTATLVRHLQHELARQGLVFPPSCVVSLRRFAAEFAPGLREAPEGVIRAVVADTMRRLPLSALGNAVSSEGMLADVLDAISKLGNSGAIAADLAAVRGLSDPLKAVVRIWAEAERRLHSLGLSLRGEIFRTAAKALAQNQARLRVWMDGFINLSPLERELVRSMAKHADLSFTLTTARAADETWRFGLAMGAADQPVSGAGRAPELCVLEADTPERECDEIARRILAICAQGIPLAEIAIAVRNRATYLPLLRVTLERFGIPARFFFSPTLQEHPASRFLTGLLRCSVNGWEFAEALDALRSHPRMGASAAFDRFDFKVREHMPGRGTDAFMDLAEDEHLRDWLHRCCSIDRVLSVRRTPQGWAKILIENARDLYRPGLVANPGRYEQAALARSHAVALETWCAAIQEAAAFWPASEAAIPFREFAEIAFDVLAAATVRPYDDRANVLQVMGEFEARQWDVAALFVCGMNDRDYPKRPQTSALLSEADAERLGRAGFQVMGTAMQEQDEQHLFELLRTRASRFFFAGFAARDTAGKKAIPSRFIAEYAPQGAGMWVAAPFVKAAPLALQESISAALVPGIRNLHDKISVSKLSDLAQCRFRFFAQALRLDPRPERPEERMQPRQTGLILHEAMEIWLGHPERDFVEIFEETFDRKCRELHVPPGYSIEAERFVQRGVAEQIQNGAQWQAESREAEVDLTFELPHGLTGTARLDRLDTLAGGKCIIVDFKSGRDVKGLAENSTKLQGPLYAYAVETQKGLQPVAVVFWSVRENKPYGWGEVPGHAFEDLKPIGELRAAETKDQIVERLEEYLAGDLRVLPENAAGCRYCDFSAVCRYERRGAAVAGGAGA